MLAVKGKHAINTNHKIRIGIFGGAFDPIHIGHINPILEIVQKHKLEKVHFIPTNIPNSKKRIEATPEERLIMVEKSIENIKNFVVDDREIKRGGKSYTYDTVKEISNEYSKVKLYSIIGSDILNTIHSWESFENILKLCNILVTQRRGCESLHLKDEISPYLTENQSVLHDVSCGKIFIDNTSIVNISSKEVRYRLRNNQSVSGLVSVSLEQWLSKNKIY